MSGDSNAFLHCGDVSDMHCRQTLLEVAAAGPAAGAAASLACLLLGLGLSAAGLGGIEVEPSAFEDSLLVGILGKPEHNTLPGSVLIHAFARAFPDFIVLALTQACLHACTCSLAYPSLNCMLYCSLTHPHTHPPTHPACSEVLQRSDICANGQECTCNRLQ